MSSVAVNNFETISALFNIEVRSMNGEKISKEELLEAIAHDVSKYIPVSKAAIFKYFSGNKALTKEDFCSITSILQQGVIRSMELSHDAALSYAHAAIICGSEANKL